MQRKTLSRFDEILKIFRKYDFDKVLGQTTRNKISPFRSEADNKELLKDDLPERLRLMLQELGTTFIKFGQLLASRPDLVGEKISEELSQLHDDNPPVSYEEIKEMIETELGGNIEKFFAEFSKDALATASIAQVHEAKLHSGERVAVKVQKPNVDEIVDTDLSIMKFIANESDRFNTGFKHLNLPAVVHEFERSITKEMDFDNELMNIRHLNDNFIYNDKIIVPVTYPDYSTEKVLTMEYVDGIKLSEVIAGDDPKYNKVLIADRIVRSYFQQLFIDGFFHADPHPGNIFVTDENAICYIDFGMMGALDEEFRQDLAELMIHFSDRNIDGLINQLIRMDILNEKTDITLLKSDLTDLFAKYYGVELSRFNGIIEDLLFLMQKYDVRLPNEFVLMARGLSMVENTGLRLDPDIDVVALLKPFARKLMVQRYNPIKMASNAKNSFFAFEHVLRALPSLISKTIYKVEEGEVTVNIEVKHISEITNQISLAIIIAALLVGSSLVMLIDVGPTFFEMPVLGFVGFTISLVLGVFTVLRYFIDF
ncbi:AarF/ABC1/UbiB kinase family protein [Methanobrevibacter sp.]|uniref:ABC1 kinase family protein n=1 Tax=Methanobrevibacter sp. TaxID=66852 RepID=UPI0025D5AC9F|nr:AarF/ABC1/UbiB kinase family protein [Methanobrevibacter sp.]MBQ2962883.1 AarF/ABC1/UbiB kinase family protein [Methanobrevibacter sp.]